MTNRDPKYTKALNTDFLLYNTILINVYKCTLLYKSFEQATSR